MIDYKVMEAKIESNEATVIKVNERLVKGRHIKIVQLHGVIYKLCPEPDCLFYKTLDKFTMIKASNNYHSKCKSCRAKESKNKYQTNPNDHIYLRWTSVNSKIKNNKDKCTLEEFTYFFNNARCPYTGKTLMEDFLNPNPNKNLRLEIDHITAIANGGNSRIDNLQVIPKVINAIKRNSTPEHFRETLNFLATFAGVK